MKSILLSIKPEWLVKILNKDKTIEVRKNKALANAIRELIKQYGKAVIYVYCSDTVNKNLIYFFNIETNLDTTIGEWEEHYQILTNKELKNITLSEDKNNICRKLNGKVVARFWCDKVEEICFEREVIGEICDMPMLPRTNTLSTQELIKKSCTKYLPYGETEIGNYLDDKGFAIHISKLEIFDKPKELSEFYKVGFNKALEDFEKEIETLIDNHQPHPISFYSVQKQYEITKAPRDYCYVEGD